MVFIFGLMVWLMVLRLCDGVKCILMLSWGRVYWNRLYVLLYRLFVVMILLFVCVMLSSVSVVVVCLFVIVRVVVLLFSLVMCFLKMLVVGFMSWV